MDPNRIPFRLKRTLGRTSSLPSLLFRSGHQQNLVGYDNSQVYIGPGVEVFLPAGLHPSGQPTPTLFVSLQLATAASSQADGMPSVVAAAQAPFSSPKESISLASQSQQFYPFDSPDTFLTLTVGSPYSVAQPTIPAQTSSASAVSPQQSGAMVSTGFPFESHSQSITEFGASSSTSTGASQSSTTSTAPTSGTSSSSELSSAVSTTSSSTTPSASASAAAARAGSFAHVAEIVLGVVVGFAVIAFIATLVSWFYKQRKRKHGTPEIASLNSTTYNDGPGEFFSCLGRRRRGKNSEDMSELGFGLSHSEFFGARSSGDEHRRSDLTLPPEKLLRDEECDKNRNTPFFRAPYTSQGFAEGSRPTLRPLPVHIHQSSHSISPSRYQHLNVLGVTPLTVANLAPGDVGSDEGGYGGGHALTMSAPPERRDSLGTQWKGEIAPPSARLTEGESLSVPWAPLIVKSHSMEEEGEATKERDFQPLALSRTSTLSLAFSRTFSQHLGRSLSKPMDGYNSLTRPPQGSFQDAQDNTAPGVQAQTEEMVKPENGTWATTIRNNFYSALNVVNNYRSGSVGSKGGSMQFKSNSSSTLPNPFSDTSRQNSILPSSNAQPTQNDALENILTPPPVRVAKRTKASLIRRQLATDEYGHIGLGIGTLSRTSTLSTSWFDAERAPETESLPRNVQPISHDVPHLVRAATGSMDSSSAHEAKPRFKQMRRKHTLRAVNRRPRISRMPVSQSSVWSSESYASSAESAKLNVGQQ